MKNKPIRGLEFYIYRLIPITLVLAFVLGVTIWLFQIKNILFIKTALIIFLLSTLLMGIWTFLGTIYRWKTFKQAYKRIDLERYLGGFGSIIYVIIGLLLSIFFMYLIVFILNNDLTQIEKNFSIQKK